MPEITQAEVMQYQGGEKVVVVTAAGELKVIPYNLMENYVNDGAARLQELEQSLSENESSGFSKLSELTVRIESLKQTAEVMSSRYTAIKYTGDFTPGTEYERNDVWRHPNYGNLYIVINEYTSGVTPDEDIMAGLVKPHQIKASDYVSSGIAQLIDILEEGSEINILPGSVIKEELVTNKRININFNGSVVDCTDEVSPVWSNYDENCYYADIDFDFGGDGTKESPERLLPRLFFDRWPLSEIRSESGSYYFTAGSESAAIQYVIDNPGTFYVQGLNGSSYFNGWEKGLHRVYVHTADSADPSLKSCRIANRRAPQVGNGSSLKNMVTLSGIHRDGVVCKGGTIKNMQEYYPAGHGTLCGGSQVIDPIVKHVNPSCPTSNCFHGFGSDEEYWPLTKIKKPIVRAWNSDAGTLVSSHGNGTRSVNGSIVVEKPDVDGVRNIASGDDIEYGIEINGGTIKNARSIGYCGCDLTLNSVSAQFNDESPTDSMIEMPAQGKKLYILKSVLIGNGQLLRNFSQSGSVFAKKSIMMCGQDSSNGRWATLPYSGESIVFEKCIVESRATSGLMEVSKIVNSGGVPISFKNSSYSNIQISGISVSNSIHAISDTKITQSGDVSLSDTSPDYYSGQYIVDICGSVSTDLQAVLIVTTSSVFDAKKATSNSMNRCSHGIEQPTSAAYIGGSNKTLLVAGHDGEMVRVDQPHTSAISITTTFSGRINDIVSNNDGTAYVLSEDGVFLYDSSDDSLVLQSMSGGNSSCVPVAGFNGDGTICLILSSDDYAISEIWHLDANWSMAYSGSKLRDISYVNGLWLAVGNDATAVWSADPETGFNNLSLNVSATFEELTSDVEKNTFYAMARQRKGSAVRVAKIEANGTSISSSDLSFISTPTAAISTVKYIRYFYDNNRFIRALWIGGAGVKAYFCENGDGYQSWSCKIKDIDSSNEKFDWPI